MLSDAEKVFDSSTIPDIVFQKLGFYAFCYLQNTMNIYYFYCFFSVLFIYLLYNIVLVLPYIDMNLPWVYLCSPS